MSNRKSNKSKLLTIESIQSLIIGTIIAFFVGKIFDPILTYLFSAFLNIGGGFIKYVSDSTYQQISNGFSEQSSMLILYVLYLSSWGLIGYIMSSIKIAYKSYTNRINDLEQKLNLEHNVSGESPNSFETISIEQSQKSIEEDKNKIQKEINSMRKKNRIEFSIVILFLVTTFSFLVFSYSRVSFINKKITILTNNIEIVSPYISDSEYKKLKSDFHSIKNSDDYSNLLSGLNVIADKQSLKLKK